ncbi:MAG: sulfatase-like hydrolase/transferase, partial [Ardenticatenaceae bacterium]
MAYLPNWEREQAVDFLNNVCPTTNPADCQAPFFLFYSTHVPHLPAQTPPGAYYDDLYKTYFHTARGVGESNLLDKPVYVRVQAGNTDQAQTDAMVRGQLRALRALDDNLAVLLATLQAKGLLDNTIIVLASDNGQLWGEHHIAHKNRPYEEAIRGPLFIRNPAWTPRVISDMVAVDLDVAPTILDLAGASPMPGDGMSLRPLAEDPAHVWPRTDLLIQGSYDIVGPALPHAFFGIRTADGLKYLQYVTGEQELYDLNSDPYELQSRDRDPSYADERAVLAARLNTYSRTLAITTMNLPNPVRNLLPDGSVSSDYSFTFAAWGGTPPYTWSSYQDPANPYGCTTPLPSGLTLTSAGELRGRPTAGGLYNFCVKVSDATAGNPQSDFREFELSVPDVVPPPTSTPTSTTVPPTSTPTNTPVPPTSTPIPPAADVIYAGSTSSGNAGGVDFENEDILSHDTLTGVWAIYFDGSDVGLSGTDVDAFDQQSDGSLLLSFSSSISVAGLGTVDDSDIVRFIPTSTGSNTAGSFAWYFDASDVSLTTNDEDVDAVSFAPDGKLVVSTSGNFSVSGVSGADEDLIVFTATQLGATTSGTWALYFDGSDVALTGSSEDINGLRITSAGQIYLTTTGDFSVSDSSGDGSDIFVCTPVTLGPATDCTFGPALYWDGSANGFGGEDLDS